MVPDEMPKCWSMVENTPIFTGLARYNSAPLLLGEGQMVKGAGMYMCKYMIKDSYELAAFLVAIADARAHIEEFLSIAEGTWTSVRAAQYFLQRVDRLNWHQRMQLLFVWVCHPVAAPIRSSTRMSGMQCGW